ncbi:general substrate transporter [Aureobasidium pullulans]|uniref:General substrate transporter n=1 Tax=Aureobasidium pullulans TaxID=5580 RepID=A0A4T0B3F9_AURPU|nr:general substrate transporter [Aureobasidium pullulans]
MKSEASVRYTEIEHSLGFWQAAKLYYPAALWVLYVNLATVLKGMDGGITGSLIGLDPFKRTFGHPYNDTYVVPAAWVSAFGYANNIGGVCGALFSGYLYEKFGPRKMIAACSVGSVGIIFLQFFSTTSAQLFVGQLLNGAIISFFPICASAYTGEVCPLALRGVMASLTNLAFICGKLISSGIMKGTNSIENSMAFRIPIATQWALPVFMLSLVYFCPDPPYWLCRKGRHEDAARSLRRFATSEVDTSLTLANVVETLELEESSKRESPNYLNCFRGTDLRRLVICVMAYDMQAFTGNMLFISYAVYFFEMAGLDSSNAFSMNLGLTALGFVGTCAAWPLLSYVGRRPAYLFGTVGLATIMLLIGVIDFAPRSTSAPTWAQCSLMLLANLIYDTTIGPFCYVMLAEVPSARLRGLTIALATVSVQVLSIVFAVAIPYAMNEDQGNWRGKVGFIFAVLGLLCTIYCFFFIPETRGRTFEELDILFERKVPSREFRTYRVDAETESSETVFAEKPYV